MNRTQLKNYAPAARRDFINAITNRARTLGITETNIADAKVEGDVLMIDGRPHAAALAPLRKKLVERINLEGFDQVMQAMAYTWFNRFVAIRYMEIHGYLDYGYRVLSHPQGHNSPEILQQASHVELPGLKKEQVIDLQLDGNKDAELYRMLLIAQCNALNSAMPFLFERIDDETELLLPDNLLHSDSVIRQLVNSIDEDNWQEIEIIGWLYQFYISERKDEVMGKVVQSADIPAATQLFTPNWIVKYLVQNSIGAQWLATYPESDLKERMDYYIEPAEQTEDVQQQLAAITPDELNPEELTLIDPACGSGHILVEAYDLFKELYRERGYPRHKIPRLILEKNLYGLDIDTRAAQMAGFALLMKARADSPRVLSTTPALNVHALHDSGEMDDQAIAHELYQAAIQLEGGESFESGQLFGGAQLATQHSSGLTENDLRELIRFFEHGRTFGSLLTVSKELGQKLPLLQSLLEQVLEGGNALAQSHARDVLEGFLKPAQLLAANYDAVVANPPYMGNKYYTPVLKKFINKHYKKSKADLYSAFIERNLSLSVKNGSVGMITIPNWMFLSSFEDIRKSILDNQYVYTFTHNGRGVWGSDFGSCSFVIKNTAIEKAKGSYRRLFEKQGSIATNNELLERFFTFPTYYSTPNQFQKIPGSPLAYWVSDETRSVFESSKGLGSYAKPLIGMRTGNNDRFMRCWHEVSLLECNFKSKSSADAVSSGKRWFPYQKGGGFRRWYGNLDYVVNWKNNGHEIKENTLTNYPQLSWDNLGWKISNERYYFQEGITWTATSSSYFGVRYAEEGCLFDVKGSFCIPASEYLKPLLGVLCCSFTQAIVKVLNPTVEIQPRDIAAIPYWEDRLTTHKPELEQTITLLIDMAKTDWNLYEGAWNFSANPLIISPFPLATISESYQTWQTQNQQTIIQMQQLEEENNRLFIDAYGLQDELTPEVPIEQITLTVNPPYRYGAGKTEAEYENLFRTDTMKELVSYAIGCMMGRYSLDKEGLVYAHAENKDFDASQYNSFAADDDGIIPITDTDWFADDACNRLVEFIETVWLREKRDGSLRDKNLMFLAEGLGKKASEAPVDTLRRYLSRDFFKDHLKTYKKRPIYWLFSSGKQKAFECLVYLHRYNEGTLSRMRHEYVLPLLGKYESRIKLLQDNIASASSTSARKKMEKELNQRQNQQLELRKYDEQLRHYTDQRIVLDLDDGVKVNYGKFGTLLANVKDVTGKKA